MTLAKTSDAGPMCLATDTRQDVGGNAAAGVGELDGDHIILTLETGLLGRVWERGE